MHTSKIIFFVVIFLTSCGGGDVEDGFDYTLPGYGSIAVSADGSAAISANHSSQKLANNSAINSCGAGCSTALEFGSYKCGSLARATNTPTFGWSSNSRKSTAESNAVTQCTNNNGVGCTVILSECNDS
jgi:hypothetical protein